jgi:hypothetical protein
MLNGQHTYGEQNTLVFLMINGVHFFVMSQVAYPIISFTVSCVINRVKMTNLVKHLLGYIVIN